MMVKLRRITPADWSPALDCAPYVVRGYWPGIPPTCSSVTTTSEPFLKSRWKGRAVIG